MIEIPENKTMLNFTVQFRLTERYLYVKLSGPWTKETALESMKCIKIEADKYQKTKILLDLIDLMRPETEMVRYYTGEYIADIFKTNYRLGAFSEAAKINRFAENVAVNRNADFRIFTDEQVACDWLLMDVVA